MSAYTSWRFPTDLTGKVIADIIWDDSEVVLTFDDGSKAYFEVEGDCCSYSWIEHITIPNDIVGAVILTKTWEDSGEVTSDYEVKGGTYSDEYISVYGNSLKTTKGEIICEYRNSSNGYYGGWMQEVTW